ncbi:MAG: 4'-phosphopantetheinyl transferase superfamily protein [Oscillospiraceae bacterium]|nr:4'-phosphopantetheinyl transferase superfamily protein [Oscillospiraceae bacterium]
MEIGIDIIEISRIKKAIKNEKFIGKVYSVSEREWLEGKEAHRYAGVFAAKEALVKCGGGVMRDYEIEHEESGKPVVRVQDSGFGIQNYKISISHSEKYATAVALKVDIGELN